MKQENCEFCSKKFSETVMKKYENWEVQLFLNQYYLGRSIIKLKRHAVDITELRRDEREELFEKVLPELENALEKIFSPDLYNHATLGNDCRHFHLHFIPRYKDERKVNGQKFIDENWNSNYEPYPEEFSISEDTFTKIQEKISDELEK